MIVVLSPAKTLDFESEPKHPAISDPPFPKLTAALAQTLRGYSAERLGDLMHINEQLADLNRQRFQTFEIPTEAEDARSAIDAFQGDVYRGLQAAKWTTKQAAYAHDHLRILSGLYGVLRPLDRILPYRLEMGTRLKTRRGKNLYEFWGSHLDREIADAIQQSGSQYLLNLASVEYFKVIDPKSQDVPVLAPKFCELRKGKPVSITVFNKMARGSMASWVIRKKVRSESKLRDFAEDGYAYSEEHSQPGKPMFLRSE
ncbi:MAG: peroxide stress protein YaaA [Planctomycetota bacterium]